MVLPAGTIMSATEAWRARLVPAMQPLLLAAAAAWPAAITLGLL